MPVTISRVEEVIAYLNENGESDTCSHYGINIETLHRYQRKMRFWQTKTPKVLLMDIETTPMQVHVWGTWKQRIGHEQIINEWNLLSYACKWLFDSKMHSSVLTPKEILARDDERLAKELWGYFDKADIIIAHNISKFDLPKAQTKFILHKLAPPSPFQVIDTLIVAQRNFRFASNKLDYIGQLIRNKGKVHTDYQLWLRCLEGDEESLRYMRQYNEEDVNLLEEAYLFLRPYIKSHPNMAIYQESHEPSCPTCGSTDIEDCGHYTTSVNRYIAFRCKNCGSICRSRSTDVSLKMKAGILAPTAR